MEVGIIGAGVVGSTMAIRLSQLGYHISVVANRRQVKAVELAKKVGARVVSAKSVVEETDLVLITTPDRVIKTLVAELTDSFHPGQIVVQFSGALSADVMAPARSRGAVLLSLHPLQTFADCNVALKSLAGTHFAVEGDDEEFGKQLVTQLGGVPHCFGTEHKALYHAAACIASNYLVVLADISVKLLHQIGFGEAEALEGLLPLIQGTVANLAQTGLPGALTGPIARGDDLIVSQHLEQLPEDIRQVYKCLGQRALEIAQAKNSLNEESVLTLSKLLDY